MFGLGLKDGSSNLSIPIAKHPDNQQNKPSKQIQKPNINNNLVKDNTIFK